MNKPRFILLGSQPSGFQSWMCRGHGRIVMAGGYSLAEAVGRAYAQWLTNAPFDVHISRAMIESLLRERGVKL